MSNNLKALAFLIFTTLLPLYSICSLGKADIINRSNPITWLGLDFSNAKYIGGAFQHGQVGEITNDKFKNVYIPAWNELFIKYDVAGAVERRKRKLVYAIEITSKVNSDLNTYDIFSKNNSDYKKLNEQKIKDLVSNYDFGANDGIGLMFFIDGLSKNLKESSAWLTFVDMKSKTVIFTIYSVAGVGGLGFKSYWAESFEGHLKNLKREYKKMHG